MLTTGVPGVEGSAGSTEPSGTEPVPTPDLGIGRRITTSWAAAGTEVARTTPPIRKRIDFNIPPRHLLMSSEFSG
jgi:hypothetical protein